MTTEIVVASANVLCTLSAGDTREALHTVLDTGPDLVGLQEWYPSRARLLRETGSVALVPPNAPRVGRTGSLPGDAGYVWSTPLLGGCAVGARADRYDLVTCRPRILSLPGLADNSERPGGVEPPRIATVAAYRDRRDGRRVTLISYHLAPGVQAGGIYRADRPLLAARHRREVDALQRLVDDEWALGHEVYAVGDSNFDGLRLARVTSAWEGREDHPGTLGPHRKIDDVHGPGRASSVTVLTTASDHRAVLALRTGRGAGNG